MDKITSYIDFFAVWNQFVSSGELEYGPLDPFIAESWQRSRQAKVNPYQSIESMQMQQTPGKELPSYLACAVQPIVEEVFNSIKGSGFHVFLADKDGLVSYVIPKSNHYNINWLEPRIGTNAIGIAIKTGQANQVIGLQHYCLAFHKFTTTAVPINSQDRLITILGLIGPVSQDHSHALTMLIKAGQTILDRCKIVNQNCKLKSYNTRLTNLINSISDGVVIFLGNGSIELINPALEEILGSKADAMVGRPLPDLFSGKAPFIWELCYKGSSFRDAEVFLNGPQGKVRCLASGHLSKNEDGTIDSGMIVLQNMDRIHRLVSRFSGTCTQYHFTDIIGTSKTLKDCIFSARAAANSNSNVLLQGESGTGKEIFAQSIHNASSRHGKPFVAINCGAIPRELIGSELFGYVEGAFTGAKRGGQIGKFEMASGGTIFLDEIGDMPFDLQVALLRVLQDRHITRIGEAREIPVDVRVICATNKNLRYEIEKGNFREDLFYRLNVISINIPPLRDRKEDIPLLIERFLNSCNQYGENIANIFQPDIMQLLKNYSWPGNIRELQNIVERLVCIAGQRPITVQDIPGEIISCSTNSNTDGAFALNTQALHRKRKRMSAEEEYQQIINLLHRYHGNITQIAQEMGLSRMTLYRKLKLYNISRGK